MSQALHSNMGGMPIEEVVPDAAMVKGVSRSSLLTGRRRVRLQPQTGTSAAANSIIQFVLADSSSLLDLNSVVLSCTMTVTGTGDTALDDGPAFIRRATVALNGTNIDDTDLANRFANANVYAGADRAWYNGAGSFANYWAQNPAMAVPQGANVQYALGDVSGCLVTASVRDKIGVQMAWPLGLVSKFFTTKQYLPLQNCGELVIQLLCDTNANAIFQRTGGTNGSYSLTNIFLEADFVQPHYLYQEMLNRVSQMEGEQGVVVPFNAVISAQSQAILGSGQANIVTSLATNNLRKIILTQTPVTEAGINYPSASAFANNSLTGVQFRVGSLYFPSQEATNAASIFWMTQSAFNCGEPIHHRNGCIDYNTFTKTTGSTGASITSSTSASATGYTPQFWGDSCVVAYGFDNAKGVEPLDADGLSVLGQAGSQIVSLMRIAPLTSSPGWTNGVVFNVHLERTRYLVLRNGALRVEGV